jgi:hypothetical protein
MKTLSLLFTIVLPLAATGAEPGKTVVNVGKDQIDFLIGDDLVTRYCIGPSIAKPYFWPLNAPGQVPVSRGWPLEKGLPKETTDHVHQKSAWFSHGDVIPEGLSVVPSSDKHVKGVDTWSESKGHGRIVCRSVESASEASVVTKNSWEDSAGTKFLDETRTIILHPAGPGRLLVLDIDLSASVCPITFGDTKEGSMGIRVNDQIRLTAKGSHSALTNADGKNGESEVWGKISDWCDYSGEIDGKMAGISIFDDSANRPRACWHSRAYGLLAANPFGRDKSGFPARAGEIEPAKLAKGEHLHLRYGIYLHGGDATEGKVAEAFEQFSKMK